jgi:NADPH-dependent 2,4-dienoyl-CoA reductase/sulfur reductase-like enzyme
VTATLSNPLLQVPGIAELGLKPRKIKKVAVVGGGLMGSGIVTALILSGYSVLLKEINDKFLQTGLGRVKGIFVVQCLAVVLFDVLSNDAGFAT